MYTGHLDSLLSVVMTVIISVKLLLSIYPSHEQGVMPQAIFDAEICGNVDAYISGHDHTLQWLAPVDSCDPDMSFILSGAGAKLESLQVWLKDSSSQLFHRKKWSYSSFWRTVVFSTVLEVSSD
jgi:hypothetical protein